MIIKFFNHSDKMWQIFGEVDKLSYRKIPYEARDKIIQEIGDAAVDATSIDFRMDRKAPVSKDDEFPDEAVLDFMNKNQLEETRIFADCPVFIMNDQGKTVEII